MVKLDHFDIVYSNQQHTFYAGQPVSGYLLIDTAYSLRPETVTLKIKGKARTHWSKHHGKASTLYSGEEHYFVYDQELKLQEEEGGRKSSKGGRPTTTSAAVVNAALPLIGAVGCGGGGGGEICRLWPPGTHYIPFSYNLPADLPNSFESKNGYIRYFAIATVERTKLKLDLHTKRTFTVISRENLNEIDGCGQSLMEDDEQDVACCFGNNGSIHSKVEVAKRGFVPGETIIMSITIDNESRKTVEYVGGRLKQHVIYYGDTTFAHFKDRSDCTWLVDKEEKTLCVGASKTLWYDCERLEKHNVSAPGQRGVTQELRILIPPIPPTLVRSNLINIKYSVKVDIGPYIRFELPIVIGTIPLLNQMSLIPSNDQKKAKKGSADSGRPDDDIQLMDDEDAATASRDDGANGFWTPMPRFVVSTVGACTTGDIRADDDSETEDESSSTGNSAAKYVPLFAFYVPEDQLND